MALFYAQFLDREVACTSAHGDLLAARRADAPVQRKILTAPPHVEDVAA